MKFKITWPDGREEVVEQSDCRTVEQFVNCRFGTSTPAKVTLADAPVEPVKVAKTVKK